MHTFQHLHSKIQDWSQIARTVADWKSQGQKIVFTNGCFDLLHYGHLHYLAEARDLGNKLIVGLNAAESVRRLKGPHRPINDELTRQHLLAALEFVDAVVVFEQDTPYELIQIILPDVLVKGGDWQAQAIVGSDIVLANGGMVKSLPYIPGYSTTNIEQKIRSW
jgi:rfaE bifunctional protein nucleotidyltransferase chain/domain